MQRHGWAFCLGLLAIGSAAAQPPADLERYPPAPDLPGVVVGQSATTIQAADKSAKPATPPGELPFEPIHPPKDKPTPKEGDPTTIPTTTLPAPSNGVAGPVCNSPSCCSTGCIDKLKAWLLHRSRAKQSGHYITPYRPPLHAWFPCEPNGNCKGGNCQNGTVTVAPTVIPPTDVSPLPPPAVMPKTPVTVMPEPRRPEAPVVVEPRSDLPPGFQSVDVGVKFCPGVAPMAKPTTQTEKVSKWRPK
jgi:hypothetical protein